MTKGLVCGIQKFSTEDGPGIRTNIFLKGCFLRCSWCHNPEMLKKEQELYYSPNRCINCLRCIDICSEDALKTNDGQIIIDRDKCTLCGQCVDICYAKALHFVANEMTVEEIIKEVKRDKNFYDRSGGGITLSGGEVLVNADFAIKIAKSAKKEGISVAIETSGFGNYEDLLELSILSDHILFDFKSIDSEIHKKHTGFGNERILENLQKISRNKEIAEKIIIRMPLISGLNDSTDIIRETAQYLNTLELNKVDFLPYHEFGVAKARNIGGNQETFEAPNDDYLISLANIVREFDIEVNILGIKE